MLMITNTNAGAKLANGGASIVVNADGSETLAPVGLLTLGKIYYAALNGLAAALAAAGSNGHVVVADAQAVTTALTVPSGVALEVESGGLLTFSGAGSLTFAARSTLLAGPYQIFAGATVAGTVVGSAGCCDAVYGEWWGAAGVSAATDTPALQAAIDFCTGTQTPATHTRTPLAPLRLCSRAYLVNADLSIVSTTGFHLLGTGREQCFLKATGTGFTSAVLHIDGSARGVFEGFTVSGDTTEKAGANPLPNAILMEWTSASARSTTGNTFRVRVGGIIFVNGINLAGFNQVDGTAFYDCEVDGSWVAGNVATFQNGIVAGNGTSGNNLDHALYNSSVDGCAVGVYANGSSFNWWGGQPTTCGVVAVFTAPVGACSLNGIRSEECGRLVQVNTGSAVVVFAARDCHFVGNTIASDGVWIYLRGTTPWVLQDVSCTTTGGVAPIIKCDGFGNPESLVATGITQQAAPGAGLVVLYGGTIQAFGYCQLNSSNVPVARYASWRNNVASQTSPPAVAATTVAVANPYPYTCSVYVSGGTVTAIAVAGVTTGLTSGLIRVPVGQSITLTYSVAPSWQWVGD